MLRLHLILISCFLVACKGNVEPVGTPPAGSSLSSLPVADFSRKLADEDTGYIEVLVSGDGHEVFQNGGKIGEIRRADRENTTNKPLLISAPASTPFGEITGHIRTAAETGISRILFLVRDGDGSEYGVVATDLPAGADPLSRIEPYFLLISAEDRISSGTGASRSPMDTGSHDRELRELTQNLELYSAAAQSAGAEPICQVHVDPRASYQRAIDVLSLANRYEIRLFFTDMKPEPQPKPLGRPVRKPTAPAQSPEPHGD